MFKPRERAPMSRLGASMRTAISTTALVEDGGPAWTAFKAKEARSSVLVTVNRKMKRRGRAEAKALRELILPGHTDPRSAPREARSR